MPITPCKLIGVGVIWNVTDNVCLSNQAEMGFNFPIDTLEIPAGDSFVPHRIPTVQKLTGRFGFRDVHSALMAAMIAGQTATGAIKHIPKEEQTIPSSSPYQVTLDQTPYKAGETLAPIEVLDENGVTYKQVSGDPAASGEFKNNGDGTLTFHQDDAGKKVYISYFWNDTSNGVTVKMDPDSIPSHKAYMFAGKLYNTRTRSWEGYLVCLFKKVMRTGEIGFAPGVGDAATIGFDWEATVETPDDAYICFPSA